MAGGRLSRKSLLLAYRIVGLPYKSTIKSSCNRRFHRNHHRMAMYETFAFGKESAEGGFKQLAIKRNTPGDDDVQFDIIYCGICHTDVHYGNNDMGGTKWPLVPGHELSGVVTSVGKNVTEHKVGDKVGVGCIVESCMTCKPCSQSQENYCANGGMTGTYQGVIKHGLIKTEHGYTHGGYSGSYTANKQFIIKIPVGYPMEAAGPIFCAGITMFSPLARWGARHGGKRVGIMGIGGLGQMGVRLAAAMGNEVTAISTTASKKQTALDIGANHFVVSTDDESMKAAAGSLDLILNTISADHQLSKYIPLLDMDGTVVQLGIVTTPHEIRNFDLIGKRKSIAGSLIGGISETQDCINFCAEKNIQPQLEIIKSDRLDEVFKRLTTKNDQVVRFVLDCQNSKQ